MLPNDSLYFTGCPMKVNVHCSNVMLEKILYLTHLFLS